MIDRFRSLAIGLSLVALVALIVVYFIVQGGEGEDLVGSREGTLPVIDFALLDYDTADNGYLLCPQDSCANAVADGIAPILPVSASQLRQIFVDFADDSPRIKTFRFDLAANQFDFTEKLPSERFPSVVTIKIVPISETSSTMVIYSWKPVGRHTKSDHFERVSRWTGIIATIARRY